MSIVNIFSAWCTVAACYYLHVKMTLLMEIRKRTQTGLLIFGVPESERLPLDIVMTPSSFEVKTPEDTMRIGLPLGIRIVPSSCRGVQYISGDGIHFRMQVQAYSSTKLVPPLKESLKVKKSCVFHCQSCGAVIMKERIFIRVLPLPTENWNSLVEEWCCHADPFANKTLRPRDNDCFLGDTYILVNATSEPFLQGITEIDSPASTSLTKKSEANPRIICKRCKAMLGERVYPDTVKYYVTEIVIQPPLKDIIMLPRSCYVASAAAQCLAEFASARSTFRFSIQGDDGKTYLLLWLLNSDTLLVEAAGQISENILTLVEDSSRHDSSSLELRNAVKVLYHPCTGNRNKELATAWETDTGVHCLTFPSHTCLELLLVLSSSNQSLPASLRCMNSFQVTELNGHIYH
ncbi:E3 ubiquitin-protein ligase E3D isoform X2 [Ambystoma mexicanum]|uniref:E3 ubiquitin-protein ligase E3D isoform X2 n=1 Tax=Ambystoma mexicanum TaxID=8296 RepID=UPI0037E84BF8